ncbi:MAG TPA: tetratricopeptide repeat protein [Streptosporangiaceae bacterium]
MHFHPQREDRPQPRELPPAPAHFTNRTDELTLLDQLAEETAIDRTPLVTVVGGAGGVGKTALLVHWLHRNHDSFPDAQFYVDLHGFASAEPMPPGEALGRFLRSLGVGPDRMPPTLDERSSLFRSLTAGRRISILADNAASAGQVRALLPGHGRSLVAVTSRRAIRGLTHEGARFIDLGPLSARGATELLGKALGDEHAVAGSDSARTVADLCGRLPIAIWATAARLARRRYWDLERVVRELADERRRIAELSTDDEVTVRAVFDLSYTALDAESAALYRVLGHFPGPDFTVPVAAAMLGADDSRCERIIEDLEDVSLVEEVADGRFRLHDLIRLHAAEKSDRIDTEPERTRALARAVSWYLANTAAADLAVLPGRWRIGPAYAAVPRDPPRFPSSRAALDWLEAELPNLMALLRAAHGAGLNAEVWQLCETLWGLFLLRKHYPEWIASHEIGIAAARACDDPVAAARMLLQLGRARLDLRELGEAERAFTESRDLARAAEHQISEATADQEIGLVHIARGEPAEAVPYFIASRRLHAELGESRGVALLTRRIGQAYRESGRYAEAVDHLEAAIDQFTELGDRFNTSRSLTDLAGTHLRAGAPRPALAALDRAQEIARDEGAEFEEASISLLRADALEMLGETAGVRAPLEHALTILRRLDAPQADTVQARLAGLSTPGAEEPGQQQVDD